MKYIRKGLIKLGLCFKDSNEEQEYRLLRIPILTHYFELLFITLSFVFVMYTIRYFTRSLWTQGIITVSFLGASFFLCFFRKKIAPLLEYIVMIYIFALCGIILANVSRGLSTSATVNSFYVGYGLALIQRIVGYRILKFWQMMVFHVISISVKFPLVGVYDGLLCAIIIVLECATVAFDYSAEKGERKLFDATFKAKRETLKFKHLLTEYFPNPLTIVTGDHCLPKYFNKSFKRTFRCDNLANTMTCLEKLIIEPETFQKHQGLFSHFGYKYTNDTSAVKLSEFVKGLPLFLQALRDLGTVNFIVTEEETKNIADILQIPPNNKKPQEAPPSSERDKIFIDSNNDLPSKKRRTSRWNLGIEHKNSPKPLSVDGFKEKSSGEENDSRAAIDKMGSRSNFSESSNEEGKKRVYKAKIFLLLWDDVEAIAIVLDDITKQKTISELKIADKNKDLVIAMVSHELRTPLNGMLGLIDIIKKMLRQVDLLPYINACRNNGVLLLSLVNSILDLSQIKNNKLKLMYTKVCIPELLAEIKSLFEYFCVLKKLYLEIEIDHNVPKFITTDRNRLSQILINLLGNAFKFTFEGGITVKVELDNLDPVKLKFSVSDTGIGIKQEDQDKLFKLFGRLEHEDKRINTSGVGLGLTISNTLALLLSAQDGPGILLQSQENQGSSFSFLIYDKPKEGSLSENSLANISGASVEENRETSVMNKMSTYTLNYLENHTKNINSQNLESKIATSPDTLAQKIQNPKNPSEYSSFPSSVNSEDGVLIRRLKSRKTTNLEIIQDMDPSERDSSPTNYSPKTRFHNHNKLADKDKPWCLIVDDNPFNLMVASHIMEEKGYNLKTAINGKDAIEKAIEHEQQDSTPPFKVILMDCQMPVMDGYEATRILRMMMNDNEIRKFPILALTANTCDEDHEKLCLEVGMSGSLTKPLQPKDLDKLLKKLNEHPQNQQST